jgi:uracil-DNA glycosylase family 4
MYSVKNSFANCSSCDLLECPSCILETNCESDLTKVDVIFIAENPGKEEVKKGVPLIGKAGNMFRKYFEKFGLHKMNYLLTNVVLCQTLNPDGTTGNPKDEVIELCKTNCMNIIRACNPKLVVLMGASPMSAFGIAKTGITNLHGNIFDWEEYKLMVIVHPSFVNRSSSIWEPKFEEAMAKISEYMSGKKIKLEKKEALTIGKGIFRYKIPEKFYTDEFRLVDVQFLNKTNQVLYIFRDKNNNKVYHREDDTFVYYRTPDGVPSKKLMPFEQLEQVSVKYKDKGQISHESAYESDVKISTKHAMDYYFHSQGECKKIKGNILFCDIEVDTGKERVFPNQKEAKFPINMISTIFNGEKSLYVIDNKTEPIQQIEGVKFKIFTSERRLMDEFIKDFKRNDPDFICGWNLINFDMDYIYNRLDKIGISHSAFSSFGEFYVDGSKYICHIPGTVVLDQEFLYKSFTFTKMENYKLGYISHYELGVTKIQLPLPFNEMYWKMLNKTIEYNIRDSELLEKLDEKLAHINLLNELRIICNTSFEGTSSFGQIDSMMVSYLKNKGLASKSSDPHITKEQYPGAYVFEPNPNVYEWITDFDFASLYPSLMITYNIGINSFVMKTEDPHLGYELTYCPDKLPEKFAIIIDPLFEKKRVEVTREQLFAKIKENNLVYTINGCFFLPHEKEFSVFGEVVDMLMKSRGEYKVKMFQAIEKKDKDLETFYYIRQLVYKVLANTLYGVVANKAFRFFDTSLASAITLAGQEALKTSIIEADAFMRSIDKGKTYISPKPLTKEEMFCDPDTQPELYRLPDRSHDYIVTGDTDSIFCCFGSMKREVNVDNIQKWCVDIEDFLNKDKIVEMVKKHNVDLDFNRLKLKNELVISRGLFLAKKRYAIRVVAQEGKKVDKINYMGVEIKRSDYPSMSKEFLIELSQMLLKSDKVSLKKLLEYVNIKEKEFKRLILEGDKRISRPVSYGKKFDDYKTIPQAVKAMEAWNSIMYNIHRTGAKAYMYWVMGVDLTKAPQNVIDNYQKFVKSGKKLEVIAIPDEEERLPDYFIVDTQATLKFSFTDRYELLLKPLLLDVERKRTQVLTF